MAKTFIKHLPGKQLLLCEGTVVAQPAEVKKRRFMVCEFDGIKGDLLQKGPESAGVGEWECLAIRMDAH